MVITRSLGAIVCTGHFHLGGTCGYFIGVFPDTHSFWSVLQLLMASVFSSKSASPCSNSPGSTDSSKTFVSTRLSRSI